MQISQRWSDAGTGEDTGAFAPESIRVWSRLEQCSGKAGCKSAVSWMSVSRRKARLGGAFGPKWMYSTVRKRGEAPSPPSSHRRHGHGCEAVAVSRRGYLLESFLPRLHAQREKKTRSLVGIERSTSERKPGRRRYVARGWKLVTVIRDRRSLNMVMETDGIRVQGL
ncbi:hypothetical protein LY78DRAFT_653345 [Colletotrichum sublineola]|nr:hypothetical protein LY78DRAFT_653345 [Colletotrichum sublineola]